MREEFIMVRFKSSRHKIYNLREYTQMRWT